MRWPGGSSRKAKEVEPVTGWKRWTMVAVILGSGIVFLDSTVVNLALKAIGQDLPSDRLGTLEGQAYVFSGYLVTLSALLILAGALNDYFGRKRMFGLGLLGFGITSVLCGLAPSLELLIVFRVLQGATGAILVPGSLSIITASFEGEEQGRAFGVWAGASALTTILGPLVGGLLVNSISWRAAFFINVPLVLLAYYATLRHVPESRDEEATGRFDWLGAVVVGLAVGGLSFGAIRGQETEWAGATPFVSLAIGAAATVAFPFLMARRRDPLVPLGLFRSRNFTVTNLSTFVIYGALYVTFTFSGVFLIGTLGYNEPAAGLAGLPATLFLAFFSTKFGSLAARYGPRAFMAAGPIIMGIGLAWFIRIPAGSEPWLFGLGEEKSLVPPADYFVDVFPAMVLFGVGLMMMVAPLTTALMTSIPARNSGVGSAINNAISRVGSPLIGALIFIAVSASFYATIAAQVPSADVDAPGFREQVGPLNPPDESVPDEVRAAAQVASTDAFHVAMAVAGGLMLLGGAVNGLGIRNPSRAKAEPERKEEATAEGDGKGLPPECCQPGPVAVAHPEADHEHRHPERTPADTS
jgi:EmrB/QacA subfamily drug resistance transporter